MSARIREKSFFSKIFGIMLLLIVLVVSAQSKPIHLQSGAIEPEKQEKTDPVDPEGNHTNRYQLLQFENTTDRRYRKSLEKNRLNFISYIPENTWLVKLREPGKISELKKLDNISHIEPFRPEYRASKRVKKIAEPGKTEIQLEFFRSTSNSTRKQLIQNYHMGSRKTKDPKTETEIEVKNSRIDDLMREESVRWLQKSMPKPEILNDASRDLIGVDTIQNSFGLNGSGFTAAEWDGGWAGRHKDLNQSGKLVRGDAGCTETDCGISDHATHVAGTMLGAGILDTSYKGVAPGSRLITYEWPTSSTSELFQETNESINKYDAVLSQNSWGYGISSQYRYLMGDYTSYSRGYDSIISQETSAVAGTLSIIFAAGNEGGNWNPRYNTTTGPGATAKNTITVGAVDDTGEMTSYSSWGPTDDGRIKPDVVADGGGGDNTQVTSTLPGNSYGSTVGTSMAAPAVSGTVLLLNQQFNRTFNRLPEPATVKALLIQNSEDLGLKGPDYKFGWGLVNASSTIKYARKADEQELIRRNSIENGEKDTYNIKVPENRSVKITVAWSDYPSTTGAGKTLVNDIDLKAYSNGEKFLPWTLNWSTRDEPATRNQEDHTNNVEQVYIPSTNSNNLTVTVEGNSIPQDPQNYSLALTEKKGKIPPEISVKSPKNNSIHQETPAFNLTSSEEIQDIAISVDGKNISLEKTGETIYYNKTLNLSSGLYNAIFYAENRFNISKTENISFRIDREKPEINAVEPENHANISESFRISATWQDNMTQVVNQSYRLEGPETVEGSLNSSLNISKLKDGRYTINYSVQDQAGNKNSDNRSITVDTAPPELEAETTEKFVSDSLNIEANYYDNLTGVKTAEYFLRNNSTQKTGELNGSVNSSSLADGNYSLEYEITDNAGNIVEEVYSFKIDNSDPELNVINPMNNSEISGLLNLSATWSDSSPINYSNYSISNTSGRVDSGYLNNSINSSSFSDGDYKINYSVQDQAGNSESKSRNVSIQNPPVITIHSPRNKSYSSLERINISSNEKLSFSTAELNQENLTLSGNTYLTNSELNLSAGSNIIKIYGEDVSGNTAIKSVVFSYDNTTPELNISINSSKVFEEWYRDSVELRFRCVDDTTRVANKSVKSGNWSNTVEASVNSTEISRSGKETYKFQCRDSAGNIAQETRNLSIDTEKPELKNIAPENNSMISREKTLNLEFSPEDNESGLNLSSVNLSASERVIENFTAVNSSVKVKISGLDYGERLELNASINDSVDHREIFEFVYTAENSPETNSEDSDSSGSSSGGSGGSGGFQTSTLNNNPGNTTEEDKNSSSETSTNSKSAYTLSSVDKSYESAKGAIRSVDASENVEITVSKIESGYEQPENSVSYSEFNISQRNRSKSDLNISFAVNQSWFDGKDLEPDSTSLYRRNNSEWQRLETRPVETTVDEVIFESEVPGFSVFTIAAENITESSKDPVESNSINRTQEQTQEDRKSAADLEHLEILIIIILLFAVPVIGYESRNWLEKEKLLNQLNNMKDETEDEKIKTRLIETEISLQNGKFMEAKEELREIKKKL